MLTWCWARVCMSTPAVAWKCSMSSFAHCGSSVPLTYATRVFDHSSVVSSLRISFESPIKYTCKQCSLQRHAAQVEPSTSRYNLRILSIWLIHEQVHGAARGAAFAATNVRAAQA
jgi:hypothetical protein